MKKLDAVRTVIVVCCITILAGIAGFSNRTVIINQKGFNWNKGSIVWYDYEATSKIILSNPLNAIETKAVEQSVSGKILIKFYGQSAGRINAVAQFNEVNSDNQILGVNFQPDGQISELIFKEGSNKSTKKKLSGLFQTLQVSLQPGKANVWTGREVSLLGEYSSKYHRLTGGNITKEITDYIKLNNTDAYTDRIEVVASQAVFKPSSNDSWLEKLELNEKLKFFRQSSKQLESNLTVSFKLNSQESTLPEWTKLEYSEILNNLSVKPVSQIHDKSISSARKEKYSSILKTAISDLGNKPKASEVLNITEKIAADLKTDPYLIENILESLQEKEMEAEAGGYLIYALQKAGSAEAQAALVNIIDLPDYHDYNKRRALIALGGIAINPESEKYLWKLYEKYAAENKNKYSEHAIYALGSTSGRLNEVNPLRSKEIINKISGELDAAIINNNYQKSGALISALGNSSLTEAAGKIYPLLRNESDKIRETAADALSNILSEDTIEILSESLPDEESPAVRKKIIYSLGKKDITAESLLAVQQAIVEEEDESVRLEMAKYLLKASEVYKGNKELLKQTLALETNREVYNILSRALAK